MLVLGISKSRIHLMCLYRNILDQGRVVISMMKWNLSGNLRFWVGVVPCFILGVGYLRLYIICKLALVIIESKLTF